jgi:hypothetical protein
MATLLGATNGLFGIATQQTGFLLDGSSQAFEQDEKMVKNISGDDTGISMYNERIQFSLSGFVPATSGYSGTIAASITLATAPEDHLIGNVTSGIYIVKGITKTQAAEEYRRIELNGTYSPTIVT